MPTSKKIQVKYSCNHCRDTMVFDYAEGEEILYAPSGWTGSPDGKYLLCNTCLETHASLDDIVSKIKESSKLR